MILMRLLIYKMVLNSISKAGIWPDRIAKKTACSDSCMEIKMLSVQDRILVSFWNKTIENHFTPTQPLNYFSDEKSNVECGEWYAIKMLELVAKCSVAFENFL